MAAASKTALEILAPGMVRAGLRAAFSVRQIDIPSLAVLIRFASEQRLAENRYRYCPEWR